MQLGKIQKLLRLLTLGLILLGSLLLLLQSYYGETEIIALGKVRIGAGDTVQFDLLAPYPAEQATACAVTLAKPLRNYLLKQGKDTEFLAVLNRWRGKLVFERIHLLTEPTAPDLQGPKNFQNMTLAIGTKPELVEMVGLDRFGYRLVQPAWARKKAPAADMVYYQAGAFAAVQGVLAGEEEFKPDLYILDGSGRIVGIRKIGKSLLTLPQFIRWLACVSFAFAPVAAGAAYCLSKRSALKSWGSRIWDHVSKRGARAAS